MMPLVDLWIFDIPRGSWVESRSRASLSAEERARCDRLMNADLRRRFAASHAGMRAILSRYTGEAPEALVFETGVAGKPRLAGGVGPWFNLSHSGEAMALAVCRECELGVDIEAPREAGEVEGIAESVFTRIERASLPAAGDPHRAEAICGIWTIKEACAKAVGQGLYLDLAAIEPCGMPCPAVSPAPAGAFDMIYKTAASGRHLVHRCAPLPGYVAAIALPEARCADHRLSYRTGRLDFERARGFVVSGEAAQDIQPMQAPDAAPMGEKHAQYA